MISGSRSLFRNSQLFYSVSQFSYAFQSFVSSFIRNEVSYYSDITVQMYHFYNTFIDQVKYDTIDFATLKDSCEGYLVLKLIENNDTQKKLDKFHDGD